MNNKLFYRHLSIEESEEIERLANEAKKLLSIGDDNLDISDTLEKISKFSESVRIDKIDKNTIEKYGYELGSLYGNLIGQKYGWKWYYLEKDNETYYCIASSDERACCATHNYIYSILNNSHNNNIKLLFNMIKEQYPKEWKFTFLT